MATAMALKLTETRLQGVLIVQAPVFEDQRGLFQEVWNQSSFIEAGLPGQFVQDNYSHSLPGVLRGLHYQVRQPQGKLVRVSRGRILDVAVDLRRDSPTFGQHLTVELDAREPAMVWIPPGFAHGFRVMGSEPVDLHYKCTEYYCPEAERTIQWNDPELAIDWQLQGTTPVISDKDGQGMPFARAEYC